MRMKDYNSRYVNSQTFRGSNEKQQVKLDISQVWEKQMVEITGVTTPVTLFMNGISSAPVDISDSALVSKGERERMGFFQHLLMSPVLHGGKNKRERERVLLMLVLSPPLLSPFHLSPLGF